MGTGDLLSAIPAELPQELVEELLHRGWLRIERIVSCGHSSPEGFWYDQDEHEWVLLVSGAARLRFEEGGRQVALRPGQYLDIPAHLRHRVEWTAPEQHTVWLAVFYREGDTPCANTLS